MSWYLYPIFGIYLISCLILVVVVLLQSGKGDAASAFGGGVGNTAFGPRGAATTLSKVTMGAAVAFMLFAFIFSLPGVLKGSSVAHGIVDKPAPAPAKTPTQPAVAPEQPKAEDKKAEEKKEAGKEEKKEEKKGEATAPAEKPADNPTK